MDTDQTALVVLVPEAEPLVAEFRRKYDPSAAEGMGAHITILAFFLPAGQIDPGITASLAEAFGGHRRFSFTLSRLQTFPGVLYLAPEPAQPFIELTQAITERFPECPPYGGVYKDITPHLTIAYTGDQQTLDGISQAIQLANPDGISIHGDVRSVSLVVRREGRWRAEARFALAE